MSEPRGETPDLDGCRVLIVEDEYLIAQDLSEKVAALGGVAVGPVATVAAAIDLLERNRLDLALVDVNLRGEIATELADRLSGAGVPIVFVTGYERGSLPDRHAHRPLVTKPFTLSALRRAIAAVQDTG